MRAIYIELLQTVKLILQTNGWKKTPMPRTPPALGWTDDPGGLMGEDGSTTLLGAFAIALGLSVTPGLNDHIYDDMKPFFAAHMPLQLAMLLDDETKYPETMPMVSWVVWRNNRFDSLQDVLDWLDWVIDVVEVKVPA